MADHNKEAQAYNGIKGGSEEERQTDNESTIDAQNFSYSEDRKIGITGAVFLILNKMIGTGSE
jgi:hypothetical protein